MYLSRRRTLHLALATTLGLCFSSFSRWAAALEREPSGYYLTGNAVRQKKLGPFRVDEAKQIRDALSDAYAMNSYTDTAKIALFLNAFTAPLPEGTTVQIRYASATKTTTLSVAGGGNASVPGVDFMQGTWSIWFGKIDQSDLGDALIRRIPMPPASSG